MTDLLGRTVGQYQLIEFIARGDSSVVYKGFQPDMNRYVAVKILAPSLARDESAREHFRREAEIMAQLEHEHILPVYDFGFEDGAAFIVTRFVEGNSLANRLSDYFTPQRALTVLSPLAEALDYLHGRGIVHGNLKPSNVLVDTQGRPLLTGLGTVREVGRTMARGNVYMSPEQAQGGKIDGRTDIYALGVILYEMMVGEPPPVGTVPGPRLKRPDLSAEVEMVILKAMAHYPEQRFQAAAEFIAALEAAVRPPAVKPVVAPEQESADEPEVLVYPAPDTARQQDNTWLIVLVVGLAAAVLICGTVAAFIFFRGRSQEEVAQPGDPTVTALTDVNVYTGPGLEYEVVGVLRQDQSAIATAVSPDGQWYQIVFAAAQNGQGWVWTLGVTVANVENLPAAQPPPTPTGELSTEPPPTEIPTEPPPTEPPPTEVPTEIPPTEIPPTEIPPTDTPPVEPPLTELPPTPEITQEPPPEATATGEFPPPQESAVPPLATVEPDDGGGFLCFSAGLGAIVVLAGVWLPRKRRRHSRKAGNW